MKRRKLHTLDPSGASNGDVVTFDVASNKYVPLPPSGGGGGGGTSVAFWRDTIAVTVAGGPTYLPLNYTPLAKSIHLYWNGIEQKVTTDWTLTGLTITFPETHQKVGDVLEARYAYDPTVPGWTTPTVTSPTAGMFTDEPYFVFTGTATSGRTVDVRVDGSSIGTTIADPAGAWSFTSPTIIAPGAHLVIARQTHPDGTTVDSAAVSFTESSFATYVASLSPLWWARMDDVGGGASVVMVDSSGNGRNGVHSSSSMGQPSLISTDTDTCVHYNGSTSHSDVTYGAWMDTMASLVITFKTSTSGVMALMTRNNGATGINPWGLELNGNNARFYPGNPVLGGTNYPTTGLALADGNRHQIVCTCDGTNFKMYVDGVLRVTTAMAAFGTGATGLVLGSCRGGGGASYLHMFNGDIDEPMMLSSVLTQAQVTKMWAKS